MAERAATSDHLQKAGETIADFHVGLIGRGIALSRTPGMHMAEGAALGMAYRYDLIDTAQMERAPDIGTLLATAVQSGLSGVNVTFPFKQSVIAHLDELSDAARAIGAVNTVVFKDGRKLGHNTDYWGFKQAFQQGLDGVRKDRALLIGAGGAGNAVANALIDSGISHLTVFDTSTSAAEDLADRLRKINVAESISTADDLDAEIGRAFGIVNATPLGMQSLPGCPLPTHLLTADHWVADIIYFPLETELLAAARKAGCRTMDGSGMAVFQAVRAFELFTGVKPDPERMRVTFDALEPQPAGSSGT